MIYFDIPVLNLRFRGRFAGRDWSHSWESYDSWIDSRTAIGALPGKCPTPGLKDVLGGLLGGSGGSWEGSGEFRGGSEGARGWPVGAREGPGRVPGWPREVLGGSWEISGGSRGGPGGSWVVRRRSEACLAAQAQCFVRAPDFW